MTETSQKRNIMIVAHIEEQGLERLQRLSPHVHIIRRPVRNGEVIPAAEWHDVEVAYTFANHLPVPEQAPNLRWVQLYSAGADSIINHPLFRSDVLFTTSSGVHAVAIGEYTLTMILAWFHGLPTLFRWQQQHEWSPDVQNTFESQEVRGKTIGIVGYGSIGRHVARLAAGCGMRVLATQRSEEHRDPGFVFPGEGDPDGSIPERYYVPEDLHMLLPECDIVLVAVPLAASTYHLFNAEAFKAMKSSAFLVNIARGDVCDEQALVQALRERWIAGAALDVFHQEPLPSDSPLWDLPNVILSPHISGLHTQYNERAATIFEENLRRYLANEPLYNLVNKGRGY